MARILSTVTLSVPSGNISKNINDTFTMTQQFATTGTGTQESVTLYWQYDQGTSTWIDIPTSGATGLTANSGQQSGAIRLTNYSRTITCKSSGTYVIRAKAVGSSTKYSSNTPMVKVNPTLQSIAGTLTLGGIITKEDNKNLNGILTLAGQIRKRIGIMLTQLKKDKK